MTTGGTARSSGATIRLPAVAGVFYPGSADRLATMIRELRSEAARLPSPAGEPAPGLPLGLLVPHAGFAYSGVTASAAWGLLAPGGDRQPPTVVILGTNHGAGWLDGVGAWDRGAWRTPLGDVFVDEALAAAVLGLGPPFGTDLDAHDLEHSIEVQLPFLQAVAPEARILPLAVSCGRGPHAVAAGEALGGLLRAWLARGEQLLLAISTDMAHYPSATTCRRVTEALVPPILAVDAPALADREAAVREARMRGLSCGMCGIEPAIVGLAALRAMGATRGTRLASATSADADGPADRSVGYLAARFDA